MRIISKLLIIFLLLVNYSTLNASHLMGGEITWVCNGNGTYEFYLKLFRDCNGVPGPNSVTLTSNGPVTAILCSLIGQNDISPVGPGCPTCPAPAGFASASEEFIYKSAEITLNGMPPAGGWYFYYSDCCRNAAITNINVSSSGAFILRAYMYAYSGQNAFPCFDNSPYFAESPTLSACTRDTIQFNPATFDIDLDSLKFEWGQPLTSIGQPAGYNSGYTYNTPLPNPNQNPLNSWPLLDSTHGIISFVSYTPGSYVTNNKISSYKCGQLVSEVFREVQISLFNCFINSFPLSYNTPPNFTTSNAVETFSLLAGDTFTYSFIATDFEFTPNSSGTVMQTITMVAKGIELGLNDTSFNTGCLIPPCAVLAYPTPISGVSLIYQDLTWPTACAHAGYNNGCLQFQRTFQFVFRLNDNCCPANGVSYKSLLVNVHGPTIQSNGPNLIVNYPNISIQWYLNGVPIPGANDTIYTPTQNGIYSILATTPGGCSMVSNSVNKVLSGIEQLADNKSSIQVFPNPANAHTGINVLLKNINTGSNLIRIIDLSGKVVKQINLSISSADEHLLIDFSDLSKGHYTISLSGKSGLISTNIVLN